MSIKLLICLGLFMISNAILVVALSRKLFKRESPRQLFMMMEGLIAGWLYAHYIFSPTLTDIISR